MLLKKRSPSINMTFEPHSYHLRQSIRSPIKYGKGVKRRNFRLASLHPRAVVCEQGEAEHERPLEDRYISNTAVIPDLLTRPASGTGAATEEEQRTPGGSDDIIIHGFTVPEYQQVYHSIVDSLLVRPGGAQVPYSVGLGATIKEQLFKELAYPSLQTTEGPDGRLEVEERFCLLRPTPSVDPGCRGEQLHRFFTT